MTRSHRARRDAASMLLIVAVLALVACSGPDNLDDTDPTATAATVETAESDVAGADDATSPEATTAPTATEEVMATATEEPAATPTATEIEPTMTPEPSPTATALPVGLEESLPTADQLPGDVYFLANEGTRSALELAEGYSDSSSHLVRLDEWGFVEHHFREFSRDPGGDENLPNYVLVTVNVYGSPEQADAAIAWLESLNASQGHTFVDPPPDIGENAIASSVATAEGTPTAIVFSRVGPRVYAVFAQAGDPQPFVLELARKVVEPVEQQAAQ